jgi:hypothetical protein
MAEPTRNRSGIIIIVVVIAALIGYLLMFPRDGQRAQSPAAHSRAVAQDGPGAPSRANPPATGSPLLSPSLDELKSNPRALDPKPLELDFARPPFRRQADGTIRKDDVILSASELNGEDHETTEDLQILTKLVGAYHQIFLQNPVAGENWEVVDALTGGNPHRLVFLDPAHPALNDRRELLDRWGNPYRFHPISRSHMEISSAGPDGHFGTRDDIELEDRGSSNE